MKLIAAYLLAVLGGNADPSAADLKNILSSGKASPHFLIVLVFLFALTRALWVFQWRTLAVGCDAKDDRIKFLLSEVKGKDITELIASGREKLASVPASGGVAVAASGGGGAAPAAAPAAEAKKEEKVEEKEESDDVSN